MHYCRRDSVASNLPSNCRETEKVLVIRPCEFLTDRHTGSLSEINLSSS